MSVEMSEESRIVQDNLEDLRKKFREYLKLSGKKTSDTDLAFHNLAFSVEEKGKKRVVSMECDLSLISKTGEKS